MQRDRVSVACAYRRAVAAPMPEVDPVTRATLVITSVVLSAAKDLTAIADGSRVKPP